MIRIAFTREGIDALERERYNHRNPKAQRRREVLYLKGLGQPNNQIKESCGISGPTLAGYLKLYRHGGIETLKECAMRAVAVSRRPTYERLKVGSKTILHTRLPRHRKKLNV